MFSMTLVYVILATIAAIVLGVVVAPYLKRKGILKEGDIVITGQMLQIIQLVISEIKMNDKTKDEAMIILQLTQLAVGYVQDMMSDKSVEEQQKAAATVVIAALNKVKIEVTDERKTMIETAIKLVIK